MSLKTAIIVPGRLGSTRFPRKLLYPIQDKPLVLWTAERLRTVAPAYPLFFAVGDGELAEVLRKAGFKAIPTDPDLPSGTDRLAAANEEVGADVVINVQADEPLVTREHIEMLFSLIRAGTDLATLATSFEKMEDFLDPNKVKVVVGKDGRALYFSRAPIPFDRDAPQTLPPGALWHLGLYAYTAATLRAFSASRSSTLERIERLEQLRILENGQCIKVGMTGRRTVGIDRPEDVPAFISALARTTH